MGDSPGTLVSAEPTHGCSSITSNKPSATARIVASGVATTTASFIVRATTASQAAASVLLAGDAAHIHSPLGGQGLNLELGDAMNLGWKLAATIQDKAPQGLLDSSTERHPLGAQILDWSRAQVAIMKPEPASRALNSIFRDLMDTPDGATYVAGRVWGVFTHYGLDGEHPLAGHSVPNFELEDSRNIGELMHDGRGMLLDFDGNPLLKTLVGEYGDQLKYVSGRAKEQLGLSAALIRPDGFIAWVSDSEPDEQSIRQAAAPWFGARTTEEAA